MIQDFSQHQMMNLLRERKSSVWALERLLEGLRDIEGRKFIVWISARLASDYGNDLFRVRSLAAEAQTSVHVVLLDQPLDASRSSYTLRDPLLTTFDRAREELGLGLLADYTGGTVNRVRVENDAENAFETIGKEMAGYYLLGVEPLDDDLDGKQHDIEVQVLRGGARLRARREVVHRSPDADETVKERLERLLMSPVAAPDLPLRVATYAYQEAEDSDMLRVLVATDLERDSAESRGNVRVPAGRPGRQDRGVAGGGSPGRPGVAGRAVRRVHHRAGTVHPEAGRGGGRGPLRQPHALVRRLPGWRTCRSPWAT